MAAPKKANKWKGASASRPAKGKSAAASAAMVPEDVEGSQEEQAVSSYDDVHDKDAHIFQPGGKKKENLM